MVLKLHTLEVAISLGKEYLSYSKNISDVKKGEAKLLNDLKV